ncbi:hypothetical protein QVD17_30233 [Tagetes erecta]|uniref:Cyclin-dependent kinase inhibitor n=1 Tax=Tagetes erecta TaxID=13708 RepID=A0AAD8K1I8_TARER|nr:hypothetical protein QVD17_30233 [Tagetes erecta]
MDNNISYDQNSPIKSHGSVRRHRDNTELTTSSSSKRTKFNFRDHEDNSPEDIVSSPNSGTCDHVSSSQSLNNRLSLDLKVELRSGSETSISGDDSFSRETSSSSEIYSDLNKTETSPPPEVTSGRNPATGKYPTVAEIDEFFTVVETKERRRFSEKYEWVRLKP